MSEKRENKPRDPDRLDIDRWGTHVIYNPVTGGVTLANAVEGFCATFSREEFDAVSRFVRKRRAATT